MQGSKQINGYLSERFWNNIEKLLVKMHLTISISEKETLLWVNWDTDAHGKTVFSGITLSTKDSDDDADTIVRFTHILKSSNGTMSHFVTNMLKTFQARVVTVTLRPVTFVMRHPRREDFKSMLNNGSKLRRVFRELMSELHAQGKVDMKIKLLTHSPNPPTHEECDSHKSSLQRLRFVSALFL